MAMGFGDDSEEERFWGGMGAWWHAIEHYGALAEKQGGVLTEEQHAEYEAIKRRARPDPGKYWNSSCLPSV